MTVELLEARHEPSVPIDAVTKSGLEQMRAGLSPESNAWIDTTGFEARAGSVALIPGAAGAAERVLFGLGAEPADPLIAGRLAAALPAGTYRLSDGFADATLAAIAVALGGYRFSRYRADAPDTTIRLIAPSSVDVADARAIVSAVFLARDLINMPANEMGPADLAAAIVEVGSNHGAKVTEIIGDDLIEAGFPLIHTVGRAAAQGRDPRLVDLTWGDPAAPKVTLVGKGVCFDTGGLDIKPSSNMLLMKKDMGGAANALALASLIMHARLPVRLRLLVPAVENAIAGNAFRPGDILRSRKGLTVEIGNTDAEGRLVLADALALASEESPDLLMDFATLTGAARVALGPDLPAVFTHDDVLANQLADCANEVADPLWRLPLWSPYFSMIETRNADINNAGKGGLAGAITAALFLERFVDDGLSWLHTDLFGWSPKAKPTGPEGGEAHTVRALYALLKRRYA